MPQNQNGMMGLSGNESVDNETIAGSGPAAWIGIFKADGQFVERIICPELLDNYVNAIDKSRLTPGEYYVIIQSAGSILTEKMEV